MKRTLLLLTVAVQALVLAGCKPEDKAAESPPRPVVSVVLTPQKDRAIGFAFMIQPRFQTDRGFRVLGRLIARPVDVGDIVAAGQTLAQIDPQLLDFAVRTSEAELVKAQAQLANATAAEGRTSTLFAKKIASQADFDNARQALDAATAGVKEAQANLAKAREQRGYATLMADAAGVVTSVDAEVGQTVAAGQKVMTIAQTDVREAVVDIPDITARTLNAGDLFTIQLQADPSITATGKIREIAPQADQATRTRRVKVTLDESIEAFRLGATITALPAVSATTETVFDIPATAVLDRGSETRVWLLDTKTKTVHTVAVTLAERDDRRARIIGQLTAGERLVVAGVNSLSEGQGIKFDEEVSP